MWGAESVCATLGQPRGADIPSPTLESNFQERASGNPSGQAAPHGAVSAFLPHARTS